MTRRSSFPFPIPRRRRSPSPWGRSPGSRIAGLLILAVIALVAKAFYVPKEERKPSDAPAQAERDLPPGQSEPGLYHVKRVVDGDTLLLTDGQRIRLIGVNTPETVKPNSPVEPFGPEASAMTKQFVAGGEVRLEFDGDRKDKYGRTLAVVWVGNRMLNEELLRAGLAVAEPQYHYSAELKKRFLRAQAEAQSAGRGIWSR